MREPVKMIPVETVLTGIKTFKQCYEEAEESLHPAVVEAAQISLNMVEEFVKKTQAVDSVPVVHGEWVVCGDGEYVPFMCSACGKTTSWYHSQTANFCPNCGAKMDNHTPKTIKTIKSLRVTQVSLVPDAEPRCRINKEEENNHG